MTKSQSEIFLQVLDQHVIKAAGVFFARDVKYVVVDSGGPNLNQSIYFGVVSLLK